MVQSMLSLSKAWCLFLGKTRKLFCEATKPRQQVYLEAFVHQILIKLRDFRGHICNQNNPDDERQLENPDSIIKLQAKEAPGVL